MLHLVIFTLETAHIVCPFVLLIPCFLLFAGAALTASAVISEGLPFLFLQYEYRFDDEYNFKNRASPCICMLTEAANA